MELRATARSFWRKPAIALAVLFLQFGAASGASLPARSGAIDFAAPQPVVDLGPSLTRERITDAADPHGSWFTITVQNRQRVPVARVLTSFGAPGAALAFEPLPARPAIAQTVPSDPAIVVERDIAFGANAFRVLLAPGRVVTLTLHLENATPRQPLLAWTETALIANNRQTSILNGLIWGLLGASTILSAAAAAMSSRVLAGWAALFLFSLLMADLTASGLLDSTGLAALTGPYALFALWISLSVAAAIRTIDYVAPFEAFWRDAGKWRDRVALAVIGIGVAAYAAAPVAGLLVRGVALFGAAAAAGYLSHCGRIGVAAARRLAPAATVFALVTAAAAFNALGLFGVNLTASAALSGFSAAGALLVALASTIPTEHSVVRLRDLRQAHSHDDLQATTTDEVIELKWEAAAIAASWQGVFDLDLASEILSLSAEGASIFGFQSAPVELKPELWTKRIMPDDYDQLRETIRVHRNRPRTPFRAEFRLLDSQQRRCELRATVTGRSDSTEHCLGLIADIGARKETEPDHNTFSTAASA
jgi:PAS domain-containing protein